VALLSLPTSTAYELGAFISVGNEVIVLITNIATLNMLKIFTFIASLLKIWYS